MEQGQLKSVLEAMIFVSEEPLTERSMIEVLQSDGIERVQIKEAIEGIKASWNDNADVGMKLVEVAGGYQFRTKTEVAEWVKRLTDSKPMRLSQASLETLAIVAYRQPIIRSEIEHVRGVDCGGVLKTLVERRLVRIVGKRDEPGQPLIYGTTKEFMELFGLNNLKDLPALADLKELAEKRVVEQSEDSEEPTVVIREDDDEPTEIIARLENDEEEDRDALHNLENNLKGLRRLEKSIFPKPEPKVDAGAEGSHEGQNDASEQGASPEGAAESATPDAADEDPPEQVDRPDQ